MKNHFTFLVCLFAATIFCMTGCEPETTDSTASATATDDSHDHEAHDHEAHDHEGHDHEGHDHEGHSHDFESLSDAMAEVEELSGEIGKAFEAGEPESAHGALHHIFDVLESTEKLVGAASLEGETKETAAKAVESLFDSFTSIDETLHGKEGKEYSKVKVAITAAIKTLKETAANLGKE